MIAKSCDVRDRDWDERLPYLLFAYQVSAQESTRTGEMPEYPQELLFPTLAVHMLWTFDDYKEDLTCNMSLAWKLASRLLKRRPTTGKQNKLTCIIIGERVMVLTPSES